MFNDDYDDKEKCDICSFTIDNMQDDSFNYIEKCSKCVFKSCKKCMKKWYEKCSQCPQCRQNFYINKYEKEIHILNRNHVNALNLIITIIFVIFIY